MSQRFTNSGMPPDLLSVEEAARILRIGRSAAYRLAREYLAAGGTSGLPVIRVGRLLRVRRHLLEELIGGPITWPVDLGTPLPDPDAQVPVEAPTQGSRRKSVVAQSAPRLFSV